MPDNPHLEKIKSILPLLTIPSVIITYYMYVQYLYSKLETLLSVKLLMDVVILQFLLIIALYYQKHSDKNASRIKKHLKKYLDEEKDGPYLIKEYDNITKFKNKEMNSSLKRLVNTRKLNNLSQNVYYLYLFSLLMGVNERIWAISVNADGEWDNCLEEQEFLRLNQKVSKKILWLKEYLLLKTTKII